MRNKTEINNTSDAIAGKINGQMYILVRQNIIRNITESIKQKKTKTLLHE